MRKNPKLGIDNCFGIWYPVAKIDEQRKRKRKRTGKDSARIPKPDNLRKFKVKGIDNLHKLW